MSPFGSQPLRKSETVEEDLPGQNYTNEGTFEDYNGPSRTSGISVNTAIKLENRAPAIRMSLASINEDEESQIPINMPTDLFEGSNFHQTLKSNLRNSLEGTIEKPRVTRGTEFQSTMKFKENIDVDID